MCPWEVWAHFGSSSRTARQWRRDKDRDRRYRRHREPGRSILPYGFVTPLDTDIAPRGIGESVIRLISAKKDEPQWFLDWRLAAYRHWATAHMRTPPPTDRRPHR
jgi:hypothetical protein